MNMFIPDEFYLLIFGVTNPTDFYTWFIPNIFNEEYKDVFNRLEHNIGMKANGGDSSLLREIVYDTVYSR